MLKDNDQSLNPTYTHETLEVAPPPSISENLTNTLNEIASVDPFICAENAIAHWHDQLRSNNVLHPSPSIRDALIAKYTYLLIECTNCQHSAYLPLSAINRPDDTPLADLAPALECTKCKQKGPPTAKIIGLKKFGPEVAELPSY